VSKTVPLGHVIRRTGHVQRNAQATSLSTLISFGKLDFVEDQLQAEQDKMIKYSIGEKLNRARLGK
jgi:hypothetical protein